MKEECKCKAGVLRDESWRAEDQLEHRVARDAESDKKSGAASVLTAHFRENMCGLLDGRTA